MKQVTAAAAVPKGKRAKSPAAARDLAKYSRQVSEPGEVRAGFPLPVGSHLHGAGANFALFSRHAERVWLEFFDQPGDGQPSRTIKLNPNVNRTGDIWHVWVKGVHPGQLYAYRVDGPYEPEQGLRFNPHKLLLDPCALAITRLDDWNFAPALGYDPESPEADLSLSEQADRAAMPKCIFTDEHFDWEEDPPLHHPWSQTIIYETHVRGLTVHPSSGVSHPGTYRGLVEKLSYLKELGVSAVELLPVNEFNENEVGRANPQTGGRLKNYWGYSTVGFFAPKASYSSSGGLGQQKLEFKELVKACHQAGLEVILDVVFNHTAEGNELGPTLSLRGIDNPIYYMLAAEKRYYQNYTGTGNTINGYHPVVRDFILDALRYWVLEMHIDGFRFDLASVLDRDEEGNLLPDSPLLERIAEDPILGETKIIAEAWDAAGAYQLGRFSETRWAEWNGRFRDDVRRFWRGDQGLLGSFASRICGSSDIYQGSGKGPESSINFITCHDGFTLNDLVSYDSKHNQANGEENRDGADENYSANYGIEGPADDPQIAAVRARQIKNFLVTLFVARGVPMLLGGDEFRRTQQGNNNAYCQDNEISWYDWSFQERYQEIFRFTQGMIALRGAHPVLSREAYYSPSEIQFFVPNGAAPDWSDASQLSLGMQIHGEDEPDLCLLFNAGTEPAAFQLPQPPQNTLWCLAVDTQRDAPDDLNLSGKEPALDDQQNYLVEARASVILVSQTKGKKRKKALR
jgi:isoamylase